LRAIFSFAAVLSQSRVGSNKSATPSQRIVVFAIINLHELGVREEIEAFKNDDLRTGIASVDDTTERHGSRIDRSNRVCGDGRRRIVE
jgi:hypothetical protein